MLQPWEDGCLPMTLSVLLVCVSPRASTGAGEENGGGEGRALCTEDLGELQVKPLGMLFFQVRTQALWRCCD